MFGDAQSSVEEREEDSLSVKAALEDGQWLDNDWFWWENAQLLVENSSPSGV